MRSVKIAVILAISALFCGGNLFAENKTPTVGDFFDEKIAEYKIEFEALLRTYEIAAKINFLKIGNTEYLAKFTLDKNSVKYIVETAGFIHNNKLQPIYVEEKTEIAIFRYTTKYYYYYDDSDDNVVRVHIKETGSTGFTTEQDLVNFSKGKYAADLLSSILQLIYWASQNDTLPSLDIVRSGYVLGGAQMKIFEKNGVKYAKLKDKKQEEDFDLQNFLAEIGDNGWPVKITLDKTWRLKNIKISLIRLLTLP